MKMITTTLSFLFLTVFLVSCLTCKGQGKSDLTQSNLDLTQAYQEKYKDIREEQGSLSGLMKANYQVLLIRGFLGEAINFGDISISPQNYFKDQIELFQNNQIQYVSISGRNFGYDPERLPSQNADSISKMITSMYDEEPQKKIIIISHSKGGLDTLATLIHHSDLLSKKVAGWISIQAPFEGTPIADLVTSKNVSKIAVGQIMRIFFGGNENVIGSMETNERKKYMNQYKNKIDHICRSIPVITVSSAVQKNELKGLLYQTSNFMRVVREIDNDGVVPTNGSVLRENGRPKSHFIKLDGIDHANPIMKSNIGLNTEAENFDRTVFTEAILRLLLEEIDGR